MDILRYLLPSRKIKRRDQLEEDLEELSYILYNFDKNEALLMKKDLIATFGPRYNLLPIRTFTLPQIIRATNNFSEQVFAHDWGAFYRGILEERPVLVTYSSSYHDSSTDFQAMRDTVVTSQMSHHKNLLPLLVCCLESQNPAIVYNNALDHQFVGEMLINPSNNCNGKVISWRNRIKMATDVSSVLIYLHTTFPTPSVFSDLTLARVVVDRYGVDKLVGFAYSTSLPPGEVSQYSLNVCTCYGYLDPEYLLSHFVRENTDVYGIGVLMLALFAGKPSALIKCAECGVPGGIPIGDCRHCVRDSRRLKQFIDPKIFKKKEENEDQILEHLLALFTLALRCTEERGDDRPDMIDVAKQLSQVNKFVCS